MYAHNREAIEEHLSLDILRDRLCICQGEFHSLGLWIIFTNGHNVKQFISRRGLEKMVNNKRKQKGIRKKKS